MFVGLGQAGKGILFLLQERGVLCVADVLAAYPGVQPKSCRRAMRHVQATQINYIGKEANRWEEQFFLGMDEDATIEYGTDPRAALFDALRLAISKFGKQQLASCIGVSRNSLTKILDMKCQNLSPRISQKIGWAITAFNSHSLDEENKNSNLLHLARVEAAKIGLSEFARRLQIDVSNLSKVTEGKRKLRGSKIF
jgi:hypothetical protein